MLMLVERKAHCSLVVRLCGPDTLHDCVRAACCFLHCWLPHYVRATIPRTTNRTMLDTLQLDANALVVQAAAGNLDLAIAESWSFSAPDPFVGPVQVRAFPWCFPAVEGVVCEPCHQRLELCRPPQRATIPQVGFDLAVSDSIGGIEAVLTASFTIGFRIDIFENPVVQLTCAVRGMC